MEDLKQWAMTICFAAMAGGIAMLLLPQSNGLSKLLRMVVSLFFLCSMVYPLASAAESLSFTQQKNSQEEIEQLAEEIEKNTSQFAYSLAKENINKLIQEKLTALKVAPREIIVYLEAEDSRVQHIRAEIYLDQLFQGREQEITDVIKKELGIDAVCCFS